MEEVEAVRMSYWTLWGGWVGELVDRGEEGGGRGEEEVHTTLSTVREVLKAVPSPSEPASEETLPVKHST